MTDFLYPTKQRLIDWKLQPKRALGQNFLLDNQIVSRMCHFLGATPHPILEVGPGPGALTWALLSFMDNPITIVEKDTQFLPILEDMKSRAAGRLSIIHGDFFHMALPQHPFCAVGNLPYNVSTEIIFHFLKAAQPPEKMIFMVQKEVADRMAAPHNRDGKSAGTKDYGRLSVMLQWCCDVKKVFDVPPSVFWPAPKVTSSVVMLTPKITAHHRALWPLMERGVKGAFSQRRKMLRQSLKTIVPDALAVLALAGLDETKRAEDLSIADFEKLAHALKEYTKKEA